ncbi:MAG: type II toxin-antitoxin system RelE/ParE family toxin [Candidatus Caenarcaniphilales bacterium]|nr:type II toxin-antitoxin system RelE/ParE family toxin [Candidatus Caenarcaniphilales bacterium]
MVDKEYVAYEGSLYTIEWFFDDKGESQPLQYADSMDARDKAKLMTLLKMMAEQGRIRNQEKFRNEHDQIYAFKPKPHRFLCFFMKGKKIIITNAFQKKQDKLPLTEKQKALENKESYERRLKQGTYYEEI